jgi:hypothetical protein
MSKTISQSRDSGSTPQDQVSLKDLFRELLSNFEPLISEAISLRDEPTSRCPSKRHFDDPSLEKDVTDMHAHLDQAFRALRLLGAMALPESQCHDYEETVTFAQSAADDVFAGSLWDAAASRTRGWLQRLEKRWGPSICVTSQSPKPNAPRIVFDDAARTATLDGIPDDEPLPPDAYWFLKTLGDPERLGKMAPRGSFTGPGLIGQKLIRVYNKLPKRWQDLITSQRGSGGGYCLTLRPKKCL